MNHLTKRLAGLALALAMLLTLLPTSALAVGETDAALTIPGYTQVTGLDQLKAGREYLVVAKGVNGNYALYPRCSSGVNADVLPSTAANYGYRCAKLAIEGSTVTATASDTSTTAGTAEIATAVSSMTSLHVVFDAADENDGYYIAAAASSAEKLPQLALNGRGLFATREADGHDKIKHAVTVDANGVFTIQNTGSFTLCFAENGTSYAVSEKGTDFYGASTSQGAPIYIFLKDELSIPGYTRVKTMPSTGLAGDYLIIATYEGNYYMLYPGATGAAPNANNSALLMVGAGGEVSGYKVGSGSSYDGAEEKSDFSAAKNTITKSGDIYSVTAAGPGDTTYYLFNGTNTVYNNSSPSTVNILAPTGKSGYFHLKNTAEYPAFLIFYPNGGNNMNFNQNSSINDTAYLGDMMLFKRDTTPLEDLQELIAEVEALTAGDYTPHSWSGLQAALTTAKDAVADSADDETLTEALTALREAKSALQAAPAVPTPGAGAEIKQLSDLRPAPGTTTGQPFPNEGVGGGDFFRIPALVRIENGPHAGRIVAAADARWSQMNDAGNIDTVFSYSDDNGESWHYSFPNFFGDTSLLDRSNKSAIFIDAVMTQDKSGNLYLMVNSNPAGVGTAGGPYQGLVATSGHVDVNGKQRLAVYTTPEGSAQTDDNWSYYVGDFAAINGSAAKYAPILDRDTDGESGFYVDEYYYLYKTSGDAKDPANDKIYCPQMASNASTNVWVQQSLYFYNATLHMRSCQYLYLIKSTNGGETWSTPKLLHEVHGDYKFYGPGPGAGIYLEDGTLILPCYRNTSSGERAGFIYSTDGGETWTATAELNIESSENTVVQIDENTLRQFFRNPSQTTVHYADYTKNADGHWTPGAVVEVSGVAKKQNNQLSALRYSQQVDGKTLILLSTAVGGSGLYTRKHGNIHVFELRSDNSLGLLASYEVNGENDWYAYSSLAELENGDVGLIYESAHTENGDSKCSLNYITISAKTLKFAILVGQAEAMDQAEYTETEDGAWAAFQTALAAAQTVLANKSATDAEMDEATAALNAAMAKLAKIQVRISGTVTNKDADNAPVAGATVTLEDEHYDPIGLTTTTDAEGKFSFTSTDVVALSVADYEVKVQAVGYQVNTFAATGLTKAEPTADVACALKPEAPGAYVNDFNDRDTSTMGALTDGDDIPTWEVVDYNGSPALKITFHSTDPFETRGINNVVDKAVKVKNGTVSFDVTGLSNTARLGVTLRATSPNNRVFVGQENDPCKWFWEWWKEGNPNSTYSTVEPKDIGIYPNATRRVRVELDEEQVQVFIDGVQIYDATMTNSPSEPGWVGLNMQDRAGTSYILDNLRIVSRDAAEGGTYTVAGTVKAGSAPLAGATVSILNGDGELVTSTTTNAVGAYQTQPVPTGTYTLKVTASGYETSATEITLEDENLTAQDISLTSTTPDDPTPDDPKPNPSPSTSTPSSSTSTKTEVKDDGTKVTTVTDNRTGTVTETVEQPDGTKSEAVTTKDGDVTITVTDPDGEELAKVELPAEIPAPETKFDDLETVPWAEKAINNVAGLELVKGSGDNKYEPTAPMTRGALATVLHRLSQGKSDYEVAFKDVAQNKYYTEGVAWATKAKVVTGYTSEIFAPNDIITREQLAVMLARYAKLIGMDTKADAKALEQFADGDSTGRWAVNGVAWCVEQGLMKGRGQNTLDPTAEISRAEVAVLLDRFLGLLK